MVINLVKLELKLKGIYFAILYPWSEGLCPLCILLCNLGLEFDPLVKEAKKSSIIRSP